MGMVLATAVSVVLLFSLLLECIKRSKKKDLWHYQREWNAAGTDVVVLHMPKRAIYAPNPSPFPMKLETWLRMNRVK